MVDRYGRCVELIRLDRGDGRGAQEWIRVSWRRVLLGPGTPGAGQGYYRSAAAALAHVDAESLVEVVELRR
jgi:hypothetical protein